MNRDFLKAFLLFAAACAVSPNADANTLDFSSVAQGEISQYGYSNGTVNTNNYIAGNCGFNFCILPAAGEFRDFFEFDVTGVTGPITSAQLVLNTGSVETAQAPAVTFQVTSLPSLTFADLGNGTVYGSRSFNSGNSNNTGVINLNAAALSAIAAGGTFSVSGRVISPTNFGVNEPSQFVFGATAGQTAQLVLNANPAPVPEPSAWALLFLGLFGIGAMMRAAQRKALVMR